MLALATIAAVVPAALLASAESQSLRVVAAPAGEVQIVSLHVDGRTRSYRLYVPSRLAAGRRHELLVALHWLNGSAARLEAMSGLDAGARSNDAVVAYPDGVGRSWDAGTCCGYATRHHLDDVKFVLRVVADVEHRVAIDPRRIAVTGFSNGALLSYRLVCERPDVFRVAVPVAGDAVGPRCTPTRPVSLLHVHGARDSVIPIGGVRTSPIDASGFPAAASSVQRIAVADRCSGAVTLSDSRTIRWTASGCAGHARVSFITARALGHHYPHGAAGARSYGVDMTTLTWSFVRSSWPN